MLYLYPSDIGTLKLAQGPAAAVVTAAEGRACTEVRVGTTGPGCFQGGSTGGDWLIASSIGSRLGGGSFSRGKPIVLWIGVAVKEGSNLVDPASSICLTWRLSHACLSISVLIAKLRMAH